MIEYFLAKAKHMLDVLRVRGRIIICISVPYTICMTTKMLKNTWKTMKTNRKSPCLLDFQLQVNLC